MVVDAQNGNVGIGALAPAGRLHVDSGDVIVTRGRVGIGTPYPDAKVHILSHNEGPNGELTSYPLHLESETNGMAIELTTPYPNRYNNYVSFWDSNAMMGRIQGQTAVDLLVNPEYIFFTAIDAAETLMEAINLAGDIADVRACAGFGAVVCAPGWSTIAASTANVAIQATKVIGTQVFLWTNLGVAYESGAGDYAEWLERLDPDEVLEPGDIVGVFGGKVTKRTQGAQQMMVVSHSPIVLGNMPPEGQESLYSMVAFMGQVPVKVSGSVRPGDYVIPSGLDDGVGVAVPARLMTAEEYAKAVGRSWGESTGERLDLVNMAVGLNQGDVAEAVLMQQALYEDLRADLAARGDDVSTLEADVAQLRASMQGLPALYEEVRALRAAVGGSVELAPVSDATGTALRGHYEETTH